MNAYEARELVVAELGEPFAYSYFDRSLFIGGPSPRLHPWSGVAAERWRMQSKFLKRANITLAPRMEPDAWRQAMAAE